MISHEILKKIGQTEFRTNRLLIISLPAFQLSRVAARVKDGQNDAFRFNQEVDATQAGISARVNSPFVIRHSASCHA